MMVPAATCCGRSQARIRRGGSGVSSSADTFANPLHASAIEDQILTDESMQMNLARRVTAEAVGTCLLLAAVVGSGIMGERLAAGNVAIALLANSGATGAALVALILTFGPISGAHFNPAVTLADASQGGMPWREVPAYLFGQLIGAFGGVAIAHAMFGEPLFSASRHVRTGRALLLSEFVATFGLLAVIWGCARLRSSMVPFAVAAYIIAACWFTSSTSFANPVVTMARSTSDTFCGIRPVDVPGFILAELLGAMAATVLFRWLVPRLPDDAKSVVVPHSSAKETVYSDDR
jgi:glycerol uptake facilitator-like aquaporin